VQKQHRPKSTYATWLIHRVFARKTPISNSFAGRATNLPVAGRQNRSSEVFSCEILLYLFLKKSSSVRFILLFNQISRYYFKYVKLQNSDPTFVVELYNYVIVHRFVQSYQEQDDQEYDCTNWHRDKRWL